MHRRACQHERHCAPVDVLLPIPETARGQRWDLKVCGEPSEQNFKKRSALRNNHGGYPDHSFLGSRLTKTRKKKTKKGLCKVPQTKRHGQQTFPHKWLLLLHPHDFKIIMENLGKMKYQLGKNKYQLGKIKNHKYYHTWDSMRVAR